MFHKKSRRLQRQASFSGVASKLMDATSEKSRKLSRQINKMARVQEEKELQERREQEEAAQQEKKKKEEGFARSIITRKLSIFGSYRRMSFSTRKPVIIVEVSNHQLTVAVQCLTLYHCRSVLNSLVRSLHNGRCEVLAYFQSFLDW